MLSTSVFSYLLPLSLLQSAITPLSSRPVPSSRISLSLPISLARSNNGAFSPSTPSLLAEALALPKQQRTKSQRQAQAESVEEGGQWEIEAMQPELDEEEDEGVWYYDTVDEEEELRQEKEFWRMLLRATSKNGEIPALFRELVEGHNFERDISKSKLSSSRPRDREPKDDSSSILSSTPAQLVLDPSTNSDSTSPLLLAQ